MGYGNPGGTRILREPGTEHGLLRWGEAVGRGEDPGDGVVSRSGLGPGTPLPVGVATITRSIIFCRGARGWDGYQAVLSREADQISISHSLDCLNVDFEPWKILNPDKRKILQRFGFGPGDLFLPDPVVYKPSRRPRLPEREEIELLIRLLEAALPILRLCRNTPGRLDEREGLILHRLPGPDGKTLQDAWLPPPETPGFRDDM